MPAVVTVDYYIQGHVVQGQIQCHTFSVQLQGCGLKVTVIRFPHKLIRASSVS